MKHKNKISIDDIGKLIALAAIILGGWLRILPPLMAGFPINDGGLFYIMARAIQENQYQLPTHVLYNGLSVPFAYPPFAFYIASLAGDLFNISLIDIFTWLPAIVLIGTLLAYYGLSRAILQSEFQAGIATFMFALTPRAITWLIMGGGLTRSFGQLFHILTLYGVYRLFTEQKTKYLTLAIAMSGLTVLTHPEATIHTIAISLLLWWFHGRTKRGSTNAIIVASGTILLAAVWWLPTLIRLGVQPFLSAGQTGLHSPMNAMIFFLTDFSGEPFMTFIVVLAIVGIVVRLEKSDYLIPLWCILPFVVEPRNAANVATIPLGMLASIAICELILPGLEKINRKNADKINDSDFHLLRPRGSKVLLAFIGIYLLMGMGYYDLTLAQKKLSKENAQAFQWINDHIPPQSRFLIVTGETDIFQDWTQEWFPALTNHVSETTVQGREWLDGADFVERLRALQDIQLCSRSLQPVNCIEELSQGFDLEYEYIYITRKTTDKPSRENPLQGELLISELQQSEGYGLVYQNEDVVIFYCSPDINHQAPLSRP
ncbi:MAG: glycosyltransferase family 39 protein [Anaerolineales bacterium]|nr:glycosyltransferase family 39 protein [Anaerolineales bacterium]